tara:strand:+ start:373 stop:588 length:216 start_codon:yes stop_codon:yes gene_type:complete
MVGSPRIPKGNIRERRLAQFMTSDLNQKSLVLESFTEVPDTRPEAPVVGRVIYTTDTKQVQVFDGEDWAGL